MAMNGDMFYKNNVCQQTGQCVSNTMAACVDQNCFYNNVQDNVVTNACKQQTTYMDKKAAGCPQQQQQRQSAAHCSMPNNYDPTSKGIGCSEEKPVVGQCCPQAPGIFDIPCMNERQLGCQPPPCCPGQSDPSHPPISDEYCPTKSDTRCAVNPGNFRPEIDYARAAMPHIGRLKERHPLDCCNPRTVMTRNQILPVEKWPLNGCFARDDRGCGIKVEGCGEPGKQCCTPMTQYMKMHGEMARQLLCGDMVLSHRIIGEPPCNVCESLNPPCRGYYREYECPMPIDPKTGKRRTKSQQYWKPCQQIEFPNEYRQYMSVPNNGLIRKLKRRIQMRKQWN